MSNLKRYDGSNWQTITINADNDADGNNIKGTYATKATVYSKSEVDSKVGYPIDSLKINKCKLRVGDKITALYIGNPQGENYASGNQISIITVTDGEGNNIQLINTFGNNDYYKNSVFTGGEIYDTGSQNDIIADWSLVKFEHRLVFGGNDSFASNRNIILCFTKQLMITSITTNSHFDEDFQGIIGFIDRASVPTASSTTLGGIKIGHVNDGPVPVEYPVELDSENKAYVSVPIYEYHGTTYGDCYAIDSPNDDYSMQIGSSGFTVDVGDTVNPDSNLLQVSSDKFQYRQSDVMTGVTKYLQSAYFKHWYGKFVCPSNTYYYRLIAKATNSGSSTNLYQTITIKGTIGGWGGSEQCEFIYTVALRDNTFSPARNIRKTIFRGSTYTTESAIASNAGIDIVTHRNSSSGALYIYLRSYGAQKYSQYNIIVTANGQEGVVTLPTDENFYTSSYGTLVLGSQLLSDTQNQYIVITSKNLTDAVSTDTTGYQFSSYFIINNMKLEWGHVDSGSGSSSVKVTVNFPSSFTGTPIVLLQTYNSTGSPSSEKESTTSQTQYRNAQSVRSVTSRGFTFDTGNAEAHGYSWMAIGRI